MSAVHDDAVALLSGWRPPSEEQRRLQEDYLAHLAAHADATQRTGPPAHLTASCLVLDDDAAHALLVLHRKGGFWVQPGGHLEADDATLAGAALREAAEETGVPIASPLGGSPAAASGGLRLRLDGMPADLDRHALGTSFGRCQEHLDVAFLATAPRSARPAASVESDAVAWWPLDALPAGVVSDLPPRLNRAAALVRTG